jgi:hypothetical protein
MRAHLDGVPGMKLGIPQIKVVVMHPQADEIFCPRFDIKGHQRIGIPPLGFPERDDVLVTIGGRVAVVPEVAFVLRAALKIHVAGIPVAGARHGLRPPMCPDAELRVAEPFRAGIIGQ